jgi:hypothetical protein
VPAAQQVQMQMMDRLSAIVARIHNDPVASIKVQGTRNICRSRHQQAQQRSILSNALCQRGNMLFGNDQQMRRSLRVDVRKYDAALILVDSVGWDGARDDLAKQAIGRHGRVWPELYFIYL